MNNCPSSPGATERDLFLAALEHPTVAERQAFLERACEGKPALRQAVEELLRHHRNDGFLESPASGPTTVATKGGADPAAIAEKPGDVIGRYKLLQEIGEGGVGTVFMAEQQEPIRRRVALKVIKAGMDTKSVIARFETERQALALMDHPNIARVLDAGTTATGRPFFVMELVRGIRITDYCDQHHLPTRERLFLFIKVCQAIQHAHQKGIIHRDIKPSNILVTLHDGVPVPKIIDFGIAKATDQRLTDKTVFTQFQAFIGTPAYMSPEQAEMSGLDIDTRTDIYSLGVLLYEMLTGKTPFDPKELLAGGLDAMRRTIREQEPMPPSTRVRTMLDGEITTTAQRQQSEPAQLARLFRGDLDWIVMKALDKDRTRRFETASALATDIERYLQNEPVTARPPSAFYRFQKFVRRNQLPVAAVGAFALALMLGLALTTWQYLEKSQAEQQQRLLRQDAQRAQQTEAQLRRQAETQEHAARLKAYAADMNLAQHALAMNNLGRAQDLLSQQRPAPITLASAGSVAVAASSNRPQAGLAADLRGWEWRYLWQECQSDALYTLCQQTNEVHALAASPDGKWVALAEATGGLSVWDLRARQEHTRLPAGVGRPAIAFSPVAPLLAFGANDSPASSGQRPRIRRWDAVTRQYEADLPLEGACRKLAFSTNGTQLLAASSDGSVTLWGLTNGAKLASFALPQLPPMDTPVQFNRDLTLVAYALENGRLRVWDLATNQERWTAQAADERITALAFSPDGKILASGAGYVESTIRLWDTATGAEMGRLEGHRTYVISLVFWPDGQTLASASGDQTIRLWDLSNIRSFPLRMGPGGAMVISREGQDSFPQRMGPGPSDAPRPEPPRPEFTRRRRMPPPPWMANLRSFATLRGHKLEVWSLALLPDKTTLVSGCKDGSVCVWDVTTLRRDHASFTLPEPVRSWSFAPDSRSILTADLQGRIHRWQGADFQDHQTILDLGPGSFSAKFSPDSRLILAGTTNGAWRVWSLESRQVLLEVPAATGQPLGFFAPSNHLLIHDTRDHSVHEWDVATKQKLRIWPGPAVAHSPLTVTGSPDARWLLWLEPEGQGLLRPLPNGQETTIDLNLSQINQVAFSPDGQFLAAVSRLGLGVLQKIADPTQSVTLTGFLQGMNSVAFSPDSRRLAIGGDGNEAVKLWDTESHWELLTLEGQGSIFNSLAFSPDGNLLGVCNLKGTLHVWRAPAMDDIAKLEARSR